MAIAGLAAMAVLAACAGLDAQQVDDREPAALVAKIITPALMDCPDRIWPGYRCGNLQALVVDNVEQRAFLWNGNGRGDLAAVAYGDLPLDFRKEGWSMGTWRGNPTLSVSPRAYGGDPETLAYLMIHEGFHHLVQKDWRSPAESLRGSTYPEEWRSRYLRRQIMASLFAAFTGPEPEAALGHAIWWQQRYAKEYPDDVWENRDTDVTEGTAEAAGLLGSELGRQGCAAPRQQLLRGLQTRIRALWQRRWDNLDAELTVRDVESYAIGALAGLILESRGVSWQQRAAAGETPMEILSGEAPPLADGDDSALEARVREHYGRRNEEFRAIVEGYQATGRSPEFLRLAIPLDWAVGATLGGKGFLNFRDSRGGFRKLIIATSGEFAAADGPARLRFSDALVELEKGAYPFGRSAGYLVTLVPAGALERMDDGSFSIASDTVLAARLRIEIRQDEEGGRWLWLR